MAMQTNLSKKDKMTIAILLFSAAVFMFIWFLIRPAISSILTLDDKIDQAKITQAHNQEKIIYLSSGEAIYVKAVEDLNNSTADYYPEMDSSEIDKMITSYVLKSGLFAENLVIKLPVDSVDETPYIYSSVSGKNVSASDVSEDSDSAENLLSPYINSRNSCTSTKSSGVRCVGITLVVTGSHSKCQAFIDDVSKKHSVRITGFKWDKVEKIQVYNEQTGQYELKDPGIERLQLDLNLYMADIEDYSNVVAEPAA